MHFQIIFTKTDKISKKDEEVLKKSFNIHQLIKENNPFFTSSKTKLGIKSIKNNIVDSLKQND